MSTFQINWRRLKCAVKELLRVATTPTELRLLFDFSHLSCRNEIKEDFPLLSTGHSDSFRVVLSIHVSNEVVIILICFAQYAFIRYTRGECTIASIFSLTMLQKKIFHWNQLCKYIQLNSSVGCCCVYGNPITKYYRQNNSKKKALY